MGRFAAEALLPLRQAAAAGSNEDSKAVSNPPQVQQQQQQLGLKDKLGLKKRSSEADGASCEDGRVDDGKAAPPAAAAAGDKSQANLELLLVGSRVQRTHSGKQKAGAGKKSLQVQQLHLYSIASPGMRRWPDNTQDLGAALAWAEPVNMKPGWVQLQKGFFQAPGAQRQLAGSCVVSNRCYDGFGNPCRASLWMAVELHTRLSSLCYSAVELLALQLKLLQKGNRRAPSCSTCMSRQLCSSLKLFHCRHLQRRSNVLLAWQAPSFMNSLQSLLALLLAGARQVDLTPSAKQSTNHQAALPDVTIVFATVAESLSFTSKQSRAAVRAVNAAIVKVMLQQMEAVPGRDGYLCR
jgi:hypothetical protein